jgi:N-terminal domain of oxidoreductase
MPQGKRIVLASRPVGEPKPSDFRVEEYPAPVPGEGQVLLRTIWLSLDPYMRGRMSDTASYAAPVPVGGVMEGGTVSEVIASNNAAFKKGEIVMSRAGWQTHAVSDGQGLIKIDPKLAPISTAVGVLGMPGMTAYFGLLEIGKPQPGETVVVAAASGAVGSAVGQIAKIKGARAVGIAGGKEKCDYVKKELSSLSMVRAGSGWSCHHLGLAATGAGAGEMAGVPAPKVAQSSRNYTPAQVLSSLIFWILYVMFVMVSASGLMATAQIAPIAKDFDVANTIIATGAGWQRGKVAD